MLLNFLHLFARSLCMFQFQVYNSMHTVYGMIFLAAVPTKKVFDHSVDLLVKTLARKLKKFQF